VDGKVTGPVAMLEYLNKVAGENGVGIVDMVENRLVGMKSRGVYETPGGTVLYYAHRELEILCIDRDNRCITRISSHSVFAELVYYGQWFHPLREALSAFVDQTQKTVSGKVRLKLYKGELHAGGIALLLSRFTRKPSRRSRKTRSTTEDAGGFINCSACRSRSSRR